VTTSLPFFLVDVFAERPLAGNPLALVLDAEYLSDDDLARIAREFNQSETTFLLPPRQPEATWRLRSFTPSGAEVVGAGHNALGAWWWLAASGQLSSESDGLSQELGDNVLGVEIVTDGSGTPTAVLMDQAPPRFEAVCDDLEPLAVALGLDARDLRSDLPAQVVDTGAAHLLVPALDAAAVDRATPRAEPLLAQLEGVGGQGCYLFALDPRDPGSTAYARFFNPTVGIWEDPATGSAAGPLAAQLARQGRVPDPATVVIEQGHALGRPSTIRIDVDGSVVRLGGAGVVVAEGTLTI